MQSKGFSFKEDCKNAAKLRRHLRKSMCAGKIKMRGNAESDFIAMPPQFEP